MRDTLTQLGVAFIGGGVLVALIAWGREAWRARKPAAIEQASLAVVAKARDELAEDNERLRQQIEEERRHHAEDRARWSAERAELIAEVDTLWAHVAELRKRIYATPDPIEETQ